MSMPVTGSWKMSLGKSSVLDNRVQYLYAVIEEEKKNMSGREYTFFAAGLVIGAFLASAGWMLHILLIRAIV